MSDSLRTRIAKALYGQILHPVPLFDSQPGEVKDAWLKDADAVIAALGLRPELGQRSKPTGPLWGGNNRYNVTRYVTEWTTDD